MVEGRRRWVERRRAEGRPSSAGRKGGEAWITEAMRERARAEVRRLGAGRFTLNRSLTLALLKSAKGDPMARAKAKAMLDAQEQAEADRVREQALAIVDRLRAEMTTRRPYALQSVGPSAYAAGGEDEADPAAKFWRNVDVALDFLGNILEGRTPQGGVQRVRLGMRAAIATIKAAIATDKNMLKAARGETSLPLRFSQKF
jgi:hypothetical protein